MFGRKNEERDWAIKSQKERLDSQFKDIMELRRELNDLYEYLGIYYTDQRNRGFKKYEVPKKP